MLSKIDGKYVRVPEEEEAENDRRRLCRLQLEQKLRQAAEKGQKAAKQCLAGHLAASSVALRSLDWSVLPTSGACAQTQLRCGDFKTANKAYYVHEHMREKNQNEKNKPKCPESWLRQCPFCGEKKAESVSHMLLHCKCWERPRAEQLQKHIEKAEQMQCVKQMREEGKHSEADEYVVRCLLGAAEPRKVVVGRRAVWLLAPTLRCKGSRTVLGEFGFVPLCFFLSSILPIRNHVFAERLRTVPETMMSAHTLCLTSLPSPSRRPMTVVVEEP